MNINIVTRTSNRPVGFKRMLDSIKAQDVFGTESAINLIIGYDNEKALEYVPKDCGFELIKTNFYGDKKKFPFFYNSYMNQLINSEKMHTGHVLFLDDDDTLRPDAISVLVKFLKPETSYIFPFIRPNGFMKPTPAMIHAKRIHRGYIGMPCLVLATEHRQYVTFDATEDSDYNAIVMLNKKVPLVWCNTPLVDASNRSYGKMEE